MTTNRPNDAGKGPAGTLMADFKRLWKDSVRQEQKARIAALHLQCCDPAGRMAWNEANRMRDGLPPEVRIDLPSSNVFARVLGLFRCIAALKHRPMEELELSAQDIADAIGYAKSTVEAALRWLSCDPIEHRGMPVAHGLGFINRTRRKALAVVAGVLKKVFRTTQSGLTTIGRAFLGLQEVVKPAAKRENPFKRKTAKKKAPPKRPSPSPSSPEPVNKQPQTSWEDNRQTALYYLAKMKAGDFTV